MSETTDQFVKDAVGVYANHLRVNPARDDLPHVLADLADWLVRALPEDFADATTAEAAIRAHPDFPKA